MRHGAGNGLKSLAARGEGVQQRGLFAGVDAAHRTVVSAVEAGVVAVFHTVIEQAGQQLLVAG